VIDGERILRFCAGSFTIVAFLVSACSHTKAHERAIRVAAAADLKFAIGVLATQFEKQTGTRVDVTYGSSGNFFSQIQNGAPFDLFFSADIEYPEKLAAAKLAESDTLYEYAVGRIVIWAPAESKLDLTRLGWKTLLDANVQKIVIANPEHAPYGRAAVAALRNAGIYEQVKTKLVYGENISQAAQLVQSGNAQAGIVAMSLAMSPGMKEGRYWAIPAYMHPAIEQGVVLLRGASNKDAARSFLEYVQSTAGRAELEKSGFAIPPARKLSAEKTKN
jgi:molybdate transport system substrate-binding protein